MEDNIRSLIDQAINGTISSEDFERLQSAIEHDVEVRQTYLKMVGLHDTLDEIASEPEGERTNFDLNPESAQKPTPFDSENAPTDSWTLTKQFAVAATVLILVGGFAFWLGRSNRSLEQDSVSERPSDEPLESRIAGHATLRRAVDVEWSVDSQRRREGDVLPDGPISFESGVAEFDFFCGATLIVEGPAKLDIESDWSVHVTEGRLRANVPPAARGFIVRAADAEIIDLGTEFALDVGSDNVRVEVIDGEVELRGGRHDGTHLLTGEGASLKGSSNSVGIVDGLSTEADLNRQQRAAESARYQRWLDYSHSLQIDDRLIAYYPISEGLTNRDVPNRAPSGDDSNGLLVGPVKQTNGRFGPDSSGLEFDRPGSRVRTRIEGDFNAFTFACWARIDSLEHRYNALFMGDSYDNGEPHWQIRNDGSLMFSVMVDDTQVIERFSEIDQQMVTQAGLHRVYYTEPFWDISKSGQWFHLVAVYDPANRRVRQYVNGIEVSSEEIIDRFHISELRIGAAEIGNWGQPFRKTPWFAVRNLNGTIDELMIFNAALPGDEIQLLYREGKPIGY